MEISYSIDASITREQFIALLNASGLGERRPVNDEQCIEGMLENSNLMVTAWHKEQLIGIARSVTDFHYACYLSDLAVHKNYQQLGLGLGKTLQNLTQKQLGPRCKLILLAAPDANRYYEKLGFTSNPRCWVLERDRRITK